MYVYDIKLLVPDVYMNGMRLTLACLPCTEYCCCPKIVALMLYQLPGTWYDLDGFSNYLKILEISKLSIIHYDSTKRRAQFAMHTRMARGTSESMMVRYPLV